MQFKLRCGFLKLTVLRELQPSDSSRCEKFKKREEAAYLPFLRHWWSTSFSLLCYSDLASQLVNIAGLRGSDFRSQHRGQRLSGEEPPRAAHIIRLTPSTTTASSTSPSDNTHTRMTFITPPLTHLPPLPLSVLPHEGETALKQLHSGAAVRTLIQVQLVALTDVGAVKEWWCQSCSSGHQWHLSPKACADKTAQEVIRGVSTLEKKVLWIYLIFMSMLVPPGPPMGGGGAFWGPVVRGAKGDQQ